MILPLVNTFIPPYELWSTRQPTLQEYQDYFQKNGHFPPFIKDRLEETVSTSLEAACYMARKGADNALEYHIDKQLDNSQEYKFWRQCMPSRTPDAIRNFQQKYPHYDQIEVDSEINRSSNLLSEGQFLFHGGLWPCNTSQLQLNRPFSTSLCPQVALRDAEWGGKAYDVGQIDLFVLRVANAKTNVFVYRRKGTRMGNEKEVLFSSGAELTLINRILIRNDYLVGKFGHPDKRIPIYVIEVEIS
jgi:hypothetical protein